MNETNIKLVNGNEFIIIYKCYIPKCKNYTYKQYSCCSKECKEILYKNPPC